MRGSLSYELTAAAAGLLGDIAVQDMMVVPAIAGDVSIGLTMLVVGVLGFIVWDELDMSERVANARWVQYGGAVGLGVIFGPEIISVALGSFAGLFTLGSLNLAGLADIGPLGALVAGALFLFAFLGLGLIDFDIFES